jgi:hypothetical protein
MERGVRDFSDVTRGLTWLRLSVAFNCEPGRTSKYVLTLSRVSMEHERQFKAHQKEAKAGPFHPF